MTNNTNKYYAGIGSRNTPTPILKLMTRFAARAEECGYTLRSGAAPGADQAFEKGANRKQIFIPWKGFSGYSLYYPVTMESACIAAEHHPRWEILGDAVQLLMARNTMQVLGEDCRTPSDFVICWTIDGVSDGKKTSMKTGGTGQAIRVATGYDVPVYNLNTPDLDGLFYDLNSRFCIDFAV